MFRYKKLKPMYNNTNNNIRAPSHSRAPSHNRAHFHGKAW